MVSTNSAVDEALSHLRRLDSDFGTSYPDDVTIDNVYPQRPAQCGGGEGGNTEWTTGFVPGMLWSAGFLTDDEKWFDSAQAHVPSFVNRIETKLNVDHHDLGFLYSLSCVTAWRHNGDRAARSAAIAAADHLIGRVLERTGVIQSWGKLDDPAQQGRAIIDSLMNMPLLYWATEETRLPRYAEVAHRHASRLSESIIRDDDTTHHTFYWDIRTGQPLHGTTAQGYADDSTWARGQAWGIYGFILNHTHTGDPALLSAAERCARRFLELLPADKVPFWDMVFTDGSDEPRDSSAGAIAVCGLFELARVTGKSEYQEAADSILDSLTLHYGAKGGAPENCLLLHGVYNRIKNRGVDEANLWGDHFYLEALLRRLHPDWVSFWSPAPPSANGRELDPRDA